MCTGLEVAALVGAGASVAGVADAQDAKRKAGHAAGDAERNRLAAEAAAAQRASAQTQMTRRALRANSLFTGGGDAGAGAGRTTLGV
jgi:hypothetical protein